MITIKRLLFAAAAVTVILIAPLLSQQVFVGYNGRNYQFAPNNGRTYQGCLSLYPVDVIVNMNGAAPGTAVSTGNLQAGTEGSGTAWSTADANGTFAAGFAPLPGSVMVQSEPSAWDCGYATQAFYHKNVSGITFNHHTLPVSQTILRLDQHIYIGMTSPSAGGPLYDLVVATTLSGESLVVQVQAGISGGCFTAYGKLYAFEIESSDACCGGSTRHSYDDNGAPGCIGVNQGGHYWVSFFVDHTTTNQGILYVYDADKGPPTALTLVGSTTVATTGTASPFSTIRYGNVETGYTSATTYTGFQNMMISWTDTTTPNVVH